MLWTKVFSLLAIQTLVFASYYQVGNLTGPSTIKAGKKFTATLIIYEVSFFDVDLSVAWGLVDPSAEDVYNFGILLGVDTLIHKLSAGVHQVNYTLTTPTELLGPYTLAAYVTREAGQVLGPDRRQEALSCMGLVAPDNQDDFSIGTLIGVNALYPTFPHGLGQKTFQLSVPQDIHGPYTLRALLPYDSAENHEFGLNQLNWDLTIL
ncbi:hypothetical protein M231_04380 [Tremella mesenterica]|uniref:Dolichyl-diphosphooligosaccharide--protein glycosyltransferase subunit 2 n=1 Tax=Tremella mesenterica TaxID=5217 RepID=A0A4Q1BKN4_TREME|nr:hypothetical protein M231_04380 [Tremella mesenterica]